MLPPDSAVLALVAAGSFGVQVLLVDYGMALASDAETGPPTIAAAFVTLLSSVPLLWIVYVLRGGATVTILPVALLPFIVGGIADPALARLCYYAGIDRVGPSIASALTAGSPAVAAIVAIPVLGERPTLPQLAGLTVVVIGVAGLQLSRQVGRSADKRVDLLRRQLREAGPVDLLYPIAAMILIGVAFVVTKIGFQAVADPLTGTVVTHSTALAAFAVVLFGRGQLQRTLQLDRTVGGVLVIAGALLALGWLAMLTALHLGSVVTVLPLVSTYPLFVVGLSYGRARELPRSPAILAGIGLILLGAGLLQVG